MTSELQIRTCRESDLPLLEQHIPSRGRSKFHERRFREQETGASTYLIAWKAGIPVGHVNVRWTEDEDLAQHFPGCLSTHWVSGLQSYVRKESDALL